MHRTAQAPGQIAVGTHHYLPRHLLTVIASHLPNLWVIHETVLRRFKSPLAFRTQHFKQVSLVHVSGVSSTCSYTIPWLGIH